MTNRPSGHMGRSASLRTLCYLYESRCSRPMLRVRGPAAEPATSYSMAARSVWAGQRRTTDRARKKRTNCLSTEGRWRARWSGAGLRLSSRASLSLLADAKGAHEHALSELNAATGHIAFLTQLREQASGPSDRLAIGPSACLT